VRAMEGIVCDADRRVIDEAPAAYKDLTQVRLCGFSCCTNVHAQADAGPPSALPMPAAAPCRLLAGPCLSQQARRRCQLRVFGQSMHGRLLQVEIRVRVGLTSTCTRRRSWRTRRTWWRSSTGSTRCSTSRASDPTHAVTMMQDLCHKVWMRVS